MLVLIACAILAPLALFVSMELNAIALPRIYVSKAATLPDKIRVLNRWIDRIEQSGKFNGAILIARNDTVLLERYVGSADETGRPITAETSFNLASVSKQFTAFAILLLAHEGKLSRQDVIGRYIPELERFGTLTIDHLLAHMSGLPDYARDTGLALRMDEEARVVTVPDLIAWLGENPQVPLFHPGEREQYSNTNYVLLAEIVARVSGQSFADFMQLRFFNPLGMRHTTVASRSTNLHALPDRARGFRKRFVHFGPKVEHDLSRMDGVAGDGNIYANGRDLVAWDAALRAGSLLPDDVIQQAYAPVHLDNGEPVRETVFGKVIQPGLGWNVQDFPEVTSYGHWQGFSNFYWRSIRDGTVLVVLSNSGFFLRTAMIGEKLAEAAAALEDGVELRR
ncbi:beta-lactamase [Nitratireductor pacificus pht-3B]|uniref:Beta-lactamase n=2 Tax=Nitratireductor TaxID=245876 RepID=K2MFB1_9HYPH|nr:beta-lactamase [Nitratireductor pacificus pht-3B]